MDGVVDVGEAAVARIAVRGDGGDRLSSLHDLAGGDVMFVATGVTDGAMLKGVHRFAGGAHTHSVVMRSRTGTLRLIEAEHDFNRRPPQD